MIASKTKSQTLHPYMRDELWLNGTLAFWRKDNSYSPKAKEYFENWLKTMEKKTKRIKENLI
jgi:hypothetical protein